MSDSIPIPGSIQPIGPVQATPGAKAAGAAGGKDFKAILVEMRDRRNEVFELISALD